MKKLLLALLLLCGSAQAQWSAWTVRPEPVFSGPFNLVGDPSVTRDGAVLRMAYTCFDYLRKPQGGAICEVTSTDGYKWIDVPTGNPIGGRILDTRPRRWDAAHETPLLLNWGGRRFLYFAGYKGTSHLSFPVQMGIATSRDWVHFSRVQSAPSIEVGAFDPDALFSPTIATYAEGRALVMVYTSYCFTNCPRAPGVYLLGAWSFNGVDWFKYNNPVVSPGDALPNGAQAAAESDLVLGPDGMYYLFASALYAQGHEIIVGRSWGPFGPWEWNPEPVVRKGAAGSFDDIGPIAPSVLIEDGKVRMWFHGFSTAGTIQIGYAEAAWPLIERR